MIWKMVGDYLVEMLIVWWSSCSSSDFAMKALDD